MLVLDESGSMEHPPATMVDTKEAANGFIDSLMANPNIKNRAGVVWYEGSARLAQILTYNINDIKNAIDTGSAGGGTRMAKGINKAAEELNDNGDAGVPKVIVHLTDGQTTHEGLAITAFNNAKSAGIKVINIGLGNGIDSNFLKDNASGNCPSSPFPNIC